MDLAGQPRVTLLYLILPLCETEMRPNPGGHKDESKKLSLLGLEPMASKL